MDDLISRQAALDALGEAPEVWTDSPEEFAALNQWEMDVTAIEALPSADRPRWIPCSERLPETHETDGGWKESEKVLTIDDIGVFSVMSYEDDGGSCRYWIDEYGTAAAGVLAWRPLPEPWKGAAERMKRRTATIACTSQGSATPRSWGSAA